MEFRLEVTDKLATALSINSEAGSAALPENIAGQEHVEAQVAETMQLHRLGSLATRNRDETDPLKGKKCLGVTDKFFPPRKHENEPAYNEEAKSICNACDVREPCLEQALQRKEPAGIWGGLTTSERERLYKQRSQSA